MTVGEALRQTTERLRSVAGDDAPQEARLLIARILNVSVPQLASVRQACWATEQEANLLVLIERRLTGEPPQYLIGEWSFMGLPILVRPCALIPRADTEVLAERAILLIRARGYKTVLDLCCGTGCIGISLAKMAGIRLVAADISEACCALTLENALRNDVQADVRCGDLFAPLAQDERFDLIVCNPPYLSADDLNALQPEVAFEPRLALDGGSDGLDFYRRIAAEYRKRLNPNGALLLEIGSAQAQTVSALFERTELLYDYAGNPRVLVIEEVK